MILPINPQHAAEVRQTFLSVIEREGKSSRSRTSVNQENPQVLQDNNQEKNLGRRIAVFVYGLVCYAITLGTFLYIAGFVGNLNRQAVIHRHDEDGDNVGQKHQSTTA